MRLMLAAACGTCLTLSGHALAQTAQDPDAPIITRQEEEATDVGALMVFGRAEQRIGKAVAASEGAVAGADIEVRPILRTGELLEAVPGMMVTQHSGSGKANQYFLRGFNLDHGTDFGLQIDGVPMNFRTHGHGQGYLDVAGLIPEIVTRVDYRKGPYRADVGDFNLVGGAIVTTRSRVDAPYVQAEGGDFGFRRIVGLTSYETMGGDLLLAAEGKNYDGPWALPEDLQHYNLYGKFTRDLAMGTFSASLAVNHATWHPTEQIPERAIGTLLPNAFGTLDPTLFGENDRRILSFQYESDRWRAQGYVQHYDWFLNSNFTFFLDDPVNGDQIEQVDKRMIYGGRVERAFAPTDSLGIVTGAEFRYDDIDRVGFYRTTARARHAVGTLSAVEEASAGVYAEATWKASDRLTVVGGLRADTYDFNVTALGGGANTGEANDNILSPKLGASWRLAPGIALYANWGQGFHSNDARGVTDPATPSPGLIKGEGREIGARFERGSAVLSATYWEMESDSELIFVGDSGAVEPSDPGKRRGVELTAFWRPLPGLALDAVWTQSHARFVGAADPFVPGAIENSAEVGFAYIRDNWNVSGRYRFLGEHPLIEDNSVRSEPTTIVNLRAAWTPGDLELFGEVLNVLNSDEKDIEYFYETFLPAIDAAPVEGVNSRAVEPRQIRVGIRKAFGRRG